MTDCRIPKPWWRLTGPKFDIIPNERAIGYHAVFHLKQLPLFYLPAFYKSLKRLPRKSGFLTPSVGRSSLYGEFFGMGYYWAINRSYDLLYDGVYYSKRGLASTVDFRGKMTPGTDFGFPPLRRERSRGRSAMDNQKRAAISLRSIRAPTSAMDGSIAGRSTI